MRRLVLLAAMFAVFGGLAAVPATAGTSVAIQRIPDARAHGGKVTVKPHVRAARGTKVVSKRLTVRRGGRVVARSRSAVRLAAGTYRVTTTVAYRTRVERTVTEKEERDVVTVTPGHETMVTCAVGGIQAGTEPVIHDLTCTGEEFDGAYTFTRWIHPKFPTMFLASGPAGLIYGEELPAVEGATGIEHFQPSIELHQRRTVTTTSTVSTWSGTKHASRTQRLRIR